MNTTEQLTKIYSELEEMIDVQVYSHELRDDLINTSRAVRKARETAFRVFEKRQPDKYGMRVTYGVQSGYDRNKGNLNTVLSKQIKSSYVDCLGEECLLVKPEFIDNHDLYFSDYVIDNDVVQYTVFHDDEDQYYAVEGEY